INDVQEPVMRTIASGTMPFMECGAEPILKRVLKKGMLGFSSNPADLKGVPTIIITIGTPVDEYLNPVVEGIKKLMDDCLSHLSDDQLIIFRSTLSPGAVNWISDYLASHNMHPLLAYCPERIVQGRAIEELDKLPQIVSGVNSASEKAAARFFSIIAPSIVRMSPLEAEYAKLFCNAYRYIQFAATNQFFVMANSAGVDYGRVLAGIKQDYPRIADLPGPGFAAGPCLYKDTVQLLAASNNKFFLGHTAVLANEGLINYILERMEKRWDLSTQVVGLLGMAFKANVDDTRSSLSYKLKRLLNLRSAAVLTTDPHVTTDGGLLPLDRVLQDSDILVLCVPHDEYRSIDPRDKPVVDVWGFLGNGCLT
ncbi:MAG: nucleotide sugar dehydrogenase, partial [Pseudomonadota bacterium]